MFLVGLTGGIGSGKSALAEHFAELGAGVVDTDRIAHELTVRTSPVLDEIRHAFGAGVFAADGSLDRSRLRALVFSDPGARARLEGILHPRIRDRMLERAAALDAPYVILVVPLLFETGLDSVVDRVLVVDCPESVQIERVARRSGLVGAEIERIIASQMPRDERLAGADDVIDNGADLARALRDVDVLHRRYLAIATEAAGRARGAGDAG